MGDTWKPLPWLVVAIAAWLALFPITSVDAYYHLAVGRRILEEGSIPSRGVGSATFGDKPWHDNEWGFQAMVAAIAPTERDPSGALVLTQGGRAALIVLRASFLAATLALLSGTMTLAGVGPTTRALGLLLAAFLGFGNLFWDIRPQIVSYAALAAVGFLLEWDRRGARWAGPGILAVFAVWANVHGAFLVGIVLVAAEAAGELVAGIRDAASRRRGARLAIIALASPIAACFNPHGWLQVTHPFRYLLEPSIHAANAEWERPRLARLPLLDATVVLYAIASWARARWRVGEILRVAAIVVLFLSAIRHLPLVAIVVVPALAGALTEAGRRGRSWSRWDPSSPAWAPGRRRALLAVAIAAIVVALSGAKFVGPTPRFEERMVRPMPENGVRFVLGEAVAGNGFNAYRFGGFLMFRLYPEERVFMDGRNDLYGDYRTEVYVPLLAAEPGWETIWDRETSRHDVGWVLIDETEPLARALAKRSGWLQGPITDGTPGRDGVVLFLRDTDANRAALAAFGRVP